MTRPSARKRTDANGKRFEHVRRLHRVATSFALTCAVVGGSVGIAAAVPPAPPNPSDQAIGAAQDQVSSGSSSLSDLINRLGQADQQITDLDGQAAERAQAVNKTLVDLQEARDHADDAAAVWEQKKAVLGSVNELIARAQDQFDDYAVNAYRTGGSGTLYGSVLGAGNSDNLLDQAGLLTVMSKGQHEALDNLQRARTQAANDESTARAAKADADSATAEAQQRQDAAQADVEAAQQELAAQQRRRDELVAQRTTAETQVAEAKATAAGLQNDREQYTQWVEASKAEAAAKAKADAENMARAAEQARQAVSAAADFTGQVVDAIGKIQDALDSADLSGSFTPDPQRSNDRASAAGSLGSLGPVMRGSAAVELVVNRALSQLGVPYAWGGGNAYGPTRGIRDGGVADRYGDYNKTGFDCSGLMMYAFAGIGISLQHYTGYQYNDKHGTKVPLSQMKRGDMIFYGANASQHVAMYLGGGQMVEAPQSGSVVKISPVRTNGAMPYVVRMA